MTDITRAPYIIRMTNLGIDARLDCGSMNGADNSEMFAKLLGYPILYRGVINDNEEFDAVVSAVRYANESKRNGRFNPKVLEEVLPNLTTKPAIVE